MKIVIGIDASRNRSGGAKAHLLGILQAVDPRLYGIDEVHVWSYQALLDVIPEQPWLIKHSSHLLEKSLWKQLYWQRFLFKEALVKHGCLILLNTSAGTVSRFRPCITMSRDMLSYEPGEITRFGLSKARFRLILLKYVQNKSLRISDGAIFLTKYAAEMIQKSCGLLPNVAYIPHGVGAEFKHSTALAAWPLKGEHPIRCVYVSNTALYKHQWEVVRAVDALRKQGYNITLTLIGGGAGRAQKRLEKQLTISDPQRLFVQQLDFLPHKELVAHLVNANVFVFASSCENMPNTLVEAMAVGLPIVCSNRGPMPEVLLDAGVYFDPENFVSITRALKEIILNPELREAKAQSAKVLSEQYSWSRCAEETWKFISGISNDVAA
ncbi:MAG: glycosyltransferase family 1 protein [Legionellaceae bacterium]|nr:glycosyltransferase family 1 protein [Legionellaceae bacterium]